MNLAWKWLDKVVGGDDGYACSVREFTVLTLYVIYTYIYIIYKLSLQK